jgi:MoxR-like ATPase
MEEGQVSIDGQRIPLPKPFMVLATQNPVESESTFRLPAAQMDRFMLRMSMGYPKPQEEREMLRRLGDQIPLDKVQAVTSAKELMEARKQVEQVYISDAVADYMIALATATREHPKLKMGASPRATRALYKASKAWAAMEGRDYVTPDDVQTLAHPVLEHRLLLKSNSRVSGTSTAAILDEILNQVPAAPDAEGLFHEG